MQGRVLAAGVSVAVGGLLAGFMAAGDHSASASSSGSSSTDSVSANQGSTGSTGSTATPNDDGGRDDFPNANTGFPSQPQPQTRTGGS